VLLEIGLALGLAHEAADLQFALNSIGSLESVSVEVLDRLDGLVVALEVDEAESARRLVALAVLRLHHDAALDRAVGLEELRESRVIQLALEALDVARGGWWGGSSAHQVVNVSSAEAKRRAFGMNFVTHLERGGVPQATTYTFCPSSSMLLTFSMALLADSSRSKWMKPYPLLSPFSSVAT